MEAAAETAAGTAAKSGFKKAAVKPFITFASLPLYFKNQFFCKPVF